MELKNIKLSTVEGILIITINRPEKLNALNFETLTELRYAVKQVYDDPVIKGAIVTGEGDKAFVAGADINEITRLNEINGRKASETGQQIFNEIENSPKLFIASLDQLIPKCLEILKKVAEKPGIAVELIINAVNSAFNKGENGFQTEANAFANCISTEDFKEGTQAFLEKRKPLFHGK